MANFVSGGVIGRAMAKADAAALGPQQLPPCTWAPRGRTTMKKMTMGQMDEASTAKEKSGQ